MTKITFFSYSLSSNDVWVSLTFFNFMVVQNVWLQNHSRGDVFPRASPRNPRLPPRGSPKWLQYTHASVFHLMGNGVTFWCWNIHFCLQQTQLYCLNTFSCNLFMKYFKMAAKTHEILSKNKNFWYHFFPGSGKTKLFGDSGFFFIYW